MVVCMDLSKNVLCDFYWILVAAGSRKQTAKTTFIEEGPWDWHCLYVHSTTYHNLADLCSECWLQGHDPVVIAYAQAEEGKDRLFNLDQQACACSASKACEHACLNENDGRVMIPSKRQANKSKHLETCPPED
eukprot:2967579-Amphidinium_carterae.1